MVLLEWSVGFIPQHAREVHGVLQDKTEREKALLCRHALRDESS